MSTRTATKKRGRKPLEKVYSLVTPEKTVSAVSSNESFLVCLKVGKKLFEHLFQEEKNSPVSESPQMPPNHNPEAFSQMLQNGNFLYIRLSIPDLYPEVKVNIKRENIIFKDYHQIDLNSINHHLNQQNDYKRVNLILPTFESGWPERSSYSCWNCTEKFENIPVGIPTVQENRKKIEYRLEGNFCSYSCAARYLFDHENGSSLWQRYDILNLLYSQVTEAKGVVTIPLAPPVLALKKFGGRLSLDEYRNASQTDREYKVYRYPLKPCPYFLEETVPIKKKKQAFVPISDLKGTQQRYKLYRKKPLTSKSYSIDRCMNIQVKKKA